MPKQIIVMRIAYSIISLQTIVHKLQRRKPSRRVWDSPEAPEAGVSPDTRRLQPPLWRVPGRLCAQTEMFSETLYIQENQTPFDERRPSILKNYRFRVEYTRDCLYAEQRVAKKCFVFILLTGLLLYTYTLY